jgi:hypothetical protein
MPVTHLMTSYLIFALPEMSNQCTNIPDIGKWTLFSDFIYCIGMFAMSKHIWKREQWACHFMQFLILVTMFVFFAISMVNQNCEPYGAEIIPFSFTIVGLIFNLIYIIVLAIAGCIQWKMRIHDSRARLLREDIL